MKRTGRISLVLLLAIVCVVGAVGVVLFLGSAEQADSIGVKFLDALGKGDNDTLAKLSYLDQTSEEQLRKKWDYTVHTVGPYYRFLYQVTSTEQNDSDHAVLRMDFYRNADRPGAYPDQYQLPLEKVQGHWKVDVGSLNRAMYPGLPK